MRITRIATMIGADVTALLAGAPAAQLTAHRLPGLAGWCAQAGPDAVAAELAGAALWLVAAWLGLALLTAAATTLPGAAGRVARAVQLATVPPLLRRLVAGSAGLTVLVAPVAATAAAAAPNPTVTAATTDSASTAGHHPRPLPSPAWPTDRHAGRHQHAQHHQPAAGRDDGHRAAARAAVQVRPGDCLWLLAASRLPQDAPPRRIAGYWPRLYAANRAVIGADPDLLHPGERLMLPPPGRGSDRAANRTTDPALHPAMHRDPNGATR